MTSKERHAQRVWAPRVTALSQYAILDTFQQVFSVWELMGRDIAMTGHSTSYLCVESIGMGDFGKEPSLCQSQQRLNEAAHACNPLIWKMRREDWGWEVSLGYAAKPSLKQNKSSCKQGRKAFPSRKTRYTCRKSSRDETATSQSSLLLQSVCQASLCESQGLRVRFLGTKVGLEYDAPGSYQWKIMFRITETNIGNLSLACGFPAIPTASLVYRVRKWPLFWNLVLFLSDQSLFMSHLPLFNEKISPLGVPPFSVFIIVFLWGSRWFSVLRDQSSVQL